LLACPLYFKDELTSDGWNTGEESNESVEKHCGECRIYVMEMSKIEWVVLMKVR
jgi:hypothetical protein